MSYSLNTPFTGPPESLGAEEMEGLEDIIRLYTREISKIPVLSLEQERELGRQIEESHREMVYLFCSYTSLEKRIIGLDILEQELKQRLGKKEAEFFLGIKKSLAGYKGKLKPGQTAEKPVEKYSGRIFGLVYDLLPKHCFDRMAGQFYAELEREARIASWEASQTRSEKRKKAYQEGGRKIKELQRKLGYCLKKEQESKSIFLHHNFRLVLSRASKYYSKVHPFAANMDFLDFVQEGNLGLKKAADRFDYRQGYKFSSYAVWWIEQRMKRAFVEKGRTIRIPAEAPGTLGRFKKTGRELAVKLGREPEFEEIVTSYNLRHKKKIRPETLKRYLEAPDEPFSLHQEIKDGMEGTLMDVVEDPNSPNPEEACLEKELKETVPQLLSFLREKQKEAIIWGFGLGEENRPLNQIAKEKGMLRQTLNARKRNGLRKLKRDMEEKGLGDPWRRN